MVGGVILAFTVLQTQSGAPLHWSPSNAPWSINDKGSADIPAGDEIPAVAASFDQWNANANFHFHAECTTTKGFNSINPSHTQNNEVNDGDSIVTWVESSWPYGTGTIAITFNWFDPGTGVISESDLLANGQDYTWTIGDVGIQTDVQDFLTHEAGHYLGMGHSADNTATMFATGNQGETIKRDLAPDDIAGEQSLYGAGSTAASGLPNGACATSPTDPGKVCNCSLAATAAQTPPRRGQIAAALLALFAAGVTLVFSRRRMRGLAALAGCAIALGFAGSAHATSMRELPLAELTATSESVIAATVEKSEAVTDGATIHTVSRVVVHEVLAGADFGVALDVVTPGGELPAGVAGPRGVRGLTAAGLPKLQVGDEVVLFVERPAGSPGVIIGSLAQGAFRVERDAHGVPRVHRDLAGVLRVVRNPDGSVEPSPWPDALDGEALDDLRTSLKSLTPRPPKTTP